MTHDVPTQESSDEDAESKGSEKKSPKKTIKKPVIKQNVFATSWDLFNSNL